MVHPPDKERCWPQLEGTSGGSEGEMFNELMEKVKLAGFNITEVVVDKDTSINAIFCRHFPDGIITYCSNHSAKTLQKTMLLKAFIFFSVRNWVVHHAR